MDARDFMNTNINQTEIATLVQNAALLLSSEVGHISGPRVREEYRLADGRILELTWDQSAGTSDFGLPRIIAYKISARRAKTWRVSR